MTIGFADDVQPFMDEVADRSGNPRQEIYRVNTAPEDPVAISSAERARIREMFAVDYDFYEWARERNALTNAQ